MLKELVVSATLLSTLVVVPHLRDNRDSDAQPRIAVVNIGQIIYQETEITPFVQNDSGILVPAPDLSEQEIESLQRALAKIESAINEIADKHGFWVVLRENDAPSMMEIPQGDPRWRGEATIMNAEQRRIKKRNRLFLDLNKRVFAHERVNITKTVLKHLETSPDRE